MRKLGIHLMTYNPEMMFGMFIPSLENLAKIAPISTMVISVNGSLYTDEQILEMSEKIREHGFQLFTYRQLDQSVLQTAKMFLKFRQNSIDYWNKLGDPPEYILELDDDMKFGPANPDSEADYECSGGQFLRSIHYMDTHPKCGVVCHASYMGTKNRPGMTYQGINEWGHNVSLQRGILLRNIPEMINQLAHREVVDTMIGGADEWTYAISRMHHGYYVARTTCGRTTHKVSSTFGQSNDRGGFGWLSYETLIDHPNGLCKTMKRVYGVDLSFNRKNSDPPYCAADMLCGVSREDTYADYRTVDPSIYSIV